ncbi:hypothetical protein [Brevundimonas diminuta]|uniref:hypothetical protein n=1 Tax=Brevundimonas diminuta TaxID=293 RepID=UPI0025A658D6|nr:hypothetical protein [Brevundimonas diminuta]MDM8352886.1 hypothetical protein [Brevundimonas diminuta]
MTMLEKAARALWTEAASYAVVKRPAWSDLPAADRSMALACARAVLMAVREPSRTEQVWMMDGRLSECSPEVAEDWRQEYERNWRAMIDAILNEGAKTNG